MKNLKRIIGTLFTVIMMAVLFPSVAKAADLYNKDESQKLQKFLNQIPVGEVKTNGEKINPDHYDAEDPSTWLGVHWDDEIADKRVISIGSEWEGKSLAGELNLSNFSKLKELHCYDNNLTSLDVRGNVSLLELYCGKNKLTTLNLGSLPELHYLICHKNVLELLDLSQLPNLGQLDCSDNQLQVLDLRNSKEIYYLYCKRNQLKQINATLLRYEYEDYVNINLKTNNQNGDIELYLGYILTLFSEEYYNEEGSFYAYAVPHAGASFLKWTGNLGNRIPEDDKLYLDYDTEGYDFTANFSGDTTVVPPIVEPQPVLYTHIVDFDLKGGTRTSGGALIQHIVDHGVAIEPTVTREGFTFKGWDKTFDRIIADTTITALWEEIPVEMKYTVTYDANGGSGTVPVDSNAYSSGDIAKLAAGTDLLKEDYDFAGWSLTAKGEAVEYKELAVIKDITFYAVWEAIEIPDTEEEPDIEVEDVVELPDTGDNYNDFLISLLIISGTVTAAAAFIYKRKIAKR